MVCTLVQLFVTKQKQQCKSSEISTETSENFLSENIIIWNLFVRILCVWRNFRWIDAILSTSLASWFFSNVAFFSFFENDSSKASKVSKNWSVRSFQINGGEMIEFSRKTSLWKTTIWWKAELCHSSGLLFRYFKTRQSPGN